MLKRCVHLAAFAGLMLCALLGLGGCQKVEGQKMQEIRFDLGKNIVETAKESGVPRFEADNINGYISYSVDSLRADIPVRFARSGYEITWQPLFAFTMRADEKRFPDRRVQSAALQLSSKAIKTHEAAQAFVEQTIAQFAKGKWQRYHDPVWDVLLTGRSSLLDESGQIAPTLRAIDPAYRIPATDWPTVAKNGAYWHWVGDGVIAKLSLTQLGDDGTPGDVRSLDYRLNLEFELLAIMLKRDEENEARENKEGDTKGWNSTAKYEASKKERAALNKRLEANAIKRGDSVVTKP